MKKWEVGMCGNLSFTATVTAKTEEEAIDQCYEILCSKPGIQHSGDIEYPDPMDFEVQFIEEKRESK